MFALDLLRNPGKTLFSDVQHLFLVDLILFVWLTIISIVIWDIIFFIFISALTFVSVASIFEVLVVVVSV
jgi:hypothetical protein